jgi:hypothetical protein
MVGVTGLAGLALQYMITPLGARLFAARLVPYDAPGVVVNFPSAYNSSAFMTDLRPVLAHTRSRLLSGAARILWTDDEFGFLPFYLADEPATRLDNNAAVAKPHNLIASTTTYSAYVAYEVVTNQTTIELESTCAQEIVNVPRTGRGCNFKQRTNLGTFWMSQLL